jgi:hypothetical protein
MPHRLSRVPLMPIAVRMAGRIALLGLLSAAVSAAVGACALGPGSKPETHVTTLADTSAANLDVDVQLERSGDRLQDLVVVIGFFVSEKEPRDTIVRFTRGESVACNGTPLANDPNAPSVPFQRTLTGISGGATLSCVYTSGGVATPISYTLPPDLQILSPQAGDTVRRSKQTIITYLPTSGPDIQGGGSNGPEFGGTASGPAQSATGTYTFDSTAVHAGAGFIGINRHSAVTPTDSGFESLQVTYGDGASVPVTFV